MNQFEEIPLQPVRVKWKCINDCGGYMQFNGFSNPTSPPIYHHECDNCGATSSIRGEKYPRVEYKVIDGEEG